MTREGISFKFDKTDFWRFQEGWWHTIATPLYRGFGAELPVLENLGEMTKSREAQRAKQSLVPGQCRQHYKAFIIDNEKFVGKRVVSLSCVSKRQSIPMLPGCRFTPTVNTKHYKYSVPKVVAISEQQQLSHKQHGRKGGSNPRRLAACEEEEYYVHGSIERNVGRWKFPSKSRERKIVCANEWWFVVHGVKVEKPTSSKYLGENVFGCLYRSDSDDDQLNGSHGEYTEGDDMEMILQAADRFEITKNVVQYNSDITDIMRAWRRVDEEFERVPISGCKYRKYVQFARKVLWFLTDYVSAIKYKRTESRTCLSCTINGGVFAFIGDGRPSTGIGRVMVELICTFGSFFPENERIDTSEEVVELDSNGRPFPITSYANNYSVESTYKWGNRWEVKISDKFGRSTVKLWKCHFNCVLKMIEDIVYHEKRKEANHRVRLCGKYDQLNGRNGEVTASDDTGIAGGEVKDSRRQKKEKRKKNGQNLIFSSTHYKPAVALKVFFLVSSKHPKSAEQGKLLKEIDADKEVMRWCFGMREDELQTKMPDSFYKKVRIYTERLSRMMANSGYEEYVEHMGNEGLQQVVPRKDIEVAVSYFVKVPTKVQNKVERAREAIASRVEKVKSYISENMYSVLDDDVKESLLSANVNRKEAQPMTTRTNGDVVYNPMVGESKEVEEASKVVVETKVKQELLDSFMPEAKITGNTIIKPPAQKRPGTTQGTPIIADWPRRMDASYLPLGDMPNGISKIPKLFPFSNSSKGVKEVQLLLQNGAAAAVNPMLQEELAYPHDADEEKADSDTSSVHNPNNDTDSEEEKGEIRIPAPPQVRDSDTASEQPDCEFCDDESEYSDDYANQTPREDNDVVLSQGGWCKYGGVIYRKMEDGRYYEYEGSGFILPQRAVVYDRKRMYLGEGDRRKVIECEFTHANIVVKAEDFVWFKKLRRGLNELGETLTLGQYFKNTIFKNFTKHRADVTYSDKCLKLLINRKIMATVTNNVNNVCAAILNNECPDIPYSIRMHTVLYFTQFRAEAQVTYNNTVDACATFVNDKRAWVAPSNYMDGDFNASIALKSYNEEGVYQFTTKAECLYYHKQGLACNAREDYTTSSTAYDNYKDPYFDELGTCFNYEHVSPKLADIAQEKGVTYDETGLHFRTREEGGTGGLTPYSTIGTCFATQKAIINHKNTKEVEKAYLRVFQPRANEVLKRQKANVLYNRVLERFINGSNNAAGCVKHIKKLEKSIRKIDKGYVGNKRNDEFCETLQIPEYELDDDTDVFCEVLAQIKLAQALHEYDGLGERLHDNMCLLESYIDDVGTKVAMRKHILNDAREFSTLPKTYIDTQMKPHEAQKYKKGHLKYGRLVMSISGDGWVEANPTVFRDGKHHMEHPLYVTYKHKYDDSGEYVETTGCKVAHGNTEREHVFSRSIRCKPKNFYYRAVLTETSNNQIAAIVQQMKNIVEDDPNGYAFINHGDDTVSALNNGRGVEWVEGDIADNDTSHNDAHFRTLYLQDCLRGEDMVKAYTQLAMPIRVMNPSNSSEKCKLRYNHGMRLLSGSTSTTYANTQNSMNAGFAHSFFGGSYPEATARLGLDVTGLTGKMSDVCFLSRIMSDVEGSVVVCTDLASISRSFGGIVSDALGSKKIPVCDRIQAHCEGVVKGHVNEPNTLFMHALRVKYNADNVAREPEVVPHGFYDTLFNDVSGVPITPSNKGVKKQPHVKRVVNALIGFCGGDGMPYTEADIGELDREIVRHYYGSADRESQGIAEYISCCNMIRVAPAYGSQIFSKFIDAAMAKRYGMQGSCM